MVIAAEMQYGVYTKDGHGIEIMGVMDSFFLL